MFDRITTAEQSKRSKFSMILLVMVLVFLFIVPVLPVRAHQIVFNTLLTGILISAAGAMDRERKRMFIIAIAAILFEWLTYFLKMPVLISLSQTVLFLYFLLIVIGLIVQVATTAKVTARVIVESITGYLLLGIVYSLIIMVVARNIPAAYAFGGVVTEIGVKGWQLSDYLYYGFVTFTTLGYGDVVPLVPAAKSISVLASVTGQLYLAVLVAMLVGKFLSGRQED